MKKLIVFNVFLLLGCQQSLKSLIRIGDTEYVSVKNTGAKGDGRNDDRAAIQNALNTGGNVYFPEGDYLLESKTDVTAMLRVSDEKYPAKILFHKRARLVVSPRQPTDYIKPAVLGISTHTGSTIKSIEIDGINIEGNRDKHKIENPGVVAFERPGSVIKRFILRNAVAKNMGGGGFHTQARYNEFFNIYTEHCGSHGIGIVNTENKGVESEFYLDGFTSIKDDAYSIDFSGYKYDEAPYACRPGYEWKGSAKNIVSKGSFYGIKTAGYWDLQLSNVVIEESSNNGFFINSDAPGKTITVRNMVIKNAKGNGMSLGGQTNFVGKNITLEGCRVGLQIYKANTDIDSLMIDSKGRNIASVRMGEGSTILKNFTIKNASAEDEYPVWVMGKNITLENGKFINNASPNEMIIHEDAQNVILKNLYFENNQDKKIAKAGIMNIQKSSKTEVIDCVFKGYNGKQIDDRTKKMLIKNIKTN